MGVVIDLVLGEGSGVRKVVEAEVRDMHEFTGAYISMLISNYVTYIYTSDIYTITTCTSFIDSRRSLFLKRTSQ